MPALQTWIVDSFSDYPYKGNACGIVFGADELCTDEMMSIARSLNQSVSAFFIEPTEEQADYHVRFFTPTNELSFAGYATISAAYAFLEKTHDLDRLSLTQQCGAGLIPIRLSKQNGSTHISMRMMRPKITQIDVIPSEIESIFKGSSIQQAKPAYMCDTGVSWVVMEVTPETLFLPINLKALSDLCNHTSCNEMAFFAKTGTDDPFVKVRAFLRPNNGLTEDPATGTAQGSIAAALWHCGDLPSVPLFSYIASQGTALGRHGTINVTLSGMDQGTPIIEVGGGAVTTLKGETRI